MRRGDGNVHPTPATMYYPAPMRTPLAVCAALLAVAVPAFAQRQLTLDEAIGIARQRSRDLRANRERRNQVRADLDRAWAPLLPTVSLQGKYTLNNQEVTLSTTAPTGTPQPGSLADLSSRLAAAQGQLQADTLADLYQGRAPSDAVLTDVAAVQQAADAAQQFCKKHPGSSECAIVIQKRNQVDFVASAQLPLVVPFAYHGLRAARLTLEAQDANNQTAESLLLLQVATAFYLAAGNDEVVVARKHGIEVARQTLDNARARLDAGVANRVDVTRAEQAVVRAEQAERESEDGAAAAYRTLATLCQLREPFKVKPGEPSSPPEPDEALIARGLTLRPEVLALRRSIAALDDAILSAKLRWAPSLSAFGLFRAFNSAGFAGNPYAWALGLQVDWLVYDAGLHSAQQRQSESVQIETGLRLEQQRDVIADEIVTARRAVGTRRQAVETARREVALTDETLTLVRVQRDAGTATQLDLLVAQDQLINAEVNLARARIELGLSAVQLRRAAGLFPGS